MKIIASILAVLCALVFLFPSAVSGQKMPAQNFANKGLAAVKLLRGNHKNLGRKSSSAKKKRMEDAKAPVRKSSTPVRVIRGTAKAAYIVVKTTAKVTYKVAKFGGKDIIKPVLFKALPKAAWFVLRKSGVATKYAMPVLVKLSIL